jgi:hypothetical protein
MAFFLGFRTGVARLNRRNDWFFRPSGAYIDLEFATVMLSS